MSSIGKLEAAAAEAGFVKSSCVHDDADQHLVLDYPEKFTGSSNPFWRVHVNRTSTPSTAHIVGSDTESQRVSLKNAIDFMYRVRRCNS